MKHSKAIIEDAKQDFLKWTPKGSTVYTVCRRVTASGTGAWYSVVCFLPGCASPAHPDYAAHVLTGRRIKEVNGHTALWVGGCGYDRARALVDDIAREVYGEDGALRHESL